MYQPEDLPLAPDDPFSVSVRRFLEGRVDPSTHASPPGNGDVDVIAVLETQERLESIVG